MNTVTGEFKCNCETNYRNISAKKPLSDMWKKSCFGRSPRWWL